MGAESLCNGSKMTKKKPTMWFWMALGAINFLALIYPIHLFVRAESVYESLFAMFVLIGFLFLLVVIDAVSIAVSDVIGSKR